MNLTCNTEEYKNLKIQSLLEAVTKQRNDAQNMSANLIADKCVLEKALMDAGAVNDKLNEIIAQLNARISQLEIQLTDTGNALAEAQAALQA